MTVSMAVMELDLTESQTIVFRNAAHGGLSVVYRRPDGNIGWIDPERTKAATGRSRGNRRRPDKRFAGPSRRARQADRADRDRAFRDHATSANCSIAIAIALRVSATNKRKALAVIAEIAARNFGLDAGDVLDALIEREAGRLHRRRPRRRRAARAPGGPDAHARRLRAPRAARWISSPSTTSRST